MNEVSVATVLRCALADLEGILPDYDPEGEHPAWATLAELRALTSSDELMMVVDRYDPETQIALIWSVGDVMDVRPDLDEEQAMQVLRNIERKHDATVGVSWETLEIAAELLFGESPPVN